MTRSSNGMSMSGAGFTGIFWRKQTRGYGPKSPRKAYTPVSERYIVRRYIGSYHPGPQILGEPEYCFKHVGVYLLPELLKKIERGELDAMDYVRQEDDVGWESPVEFAKRMRPKKKRRVSISSKIKKLKAAIRSLRRIKKTSPNRKKLTKTRAYRRGTK